MEAMMAPQMSATWMRDTQLVADGGGGNGDPPGGWVPRVVGGGVSDDVSDRSGGVVDGEVGREVDEVVGD